jgi:5-formyltetrahydrofolate cyclo-ligase
MTRDALKRALRAAAFDARAAAHAADPGAPRRAAGHALAVISDLPPGAMVAGYRPVRSEIDPEPLMLALEGLGFGLCLPVIVGRDLPLVFREWRPGAPMEAGTFGIEIPAASVPAEPDLLVVPMLAFDRRGHRLGYGGGFYDRTIAALQARRSLRAIGLAFAAQEVAPLPDADTDMCLDAIVTEVGVILPGP